MGHVRAGAGLAALVLAACPACGGGGGDVPARSLLELAPLRGERAATLETGESVVYALDVPGGGTLRYAGSSTGPGTLTLALASADAATAVEEPRAAPVTLSVDGAFEHELALPPGPSGAPRNRALLVAELAWEGAGELRLETLELVEAAPRARPSILFLSVDTLAANHLSSYGYPRETTPNLDRLARESVLFESCMANAPWTTPSYASQLTGLYAPVFQCDPEDRPDLLTYLVPDERWTLAERLAAAGYRTAAFVDNPVAGPEFGLAQGFELYDMSAAGISVGEQAGGVRHIVPRAEEWVAGLDADEPFFLLVQVVDCHLPYLPPEAYAARFGSDALWDRERTAPVARTTARYDSLPRRAVLPLFDDEPPAEMRTAPFVDAYDAEIADIDDAFGAFLDALEAAGRLEDTIVVLAADHGESMLSHRWFFGHGTCYDEVLHVPLIVRLPGAEHAGRRVGQDVQLVDLVPTLADLVGLTMDADASHGRSLVPLLEGGSLGSVPILSGRGMHYASALRHGRWKLIEKTLAKAHTEIFLSHPSARAWIATELGEDHGDLTAEELAAILAERGEPPRDFVPRLLEDFSKPIYELYDVAADPDETRDLAREHPEELARMKALLAAEYERVAEARTWPSSTPDGAELSEALMREVEKLGYAGGD